MPNKRDIPCAACGRPMWRGKSSLPPGEATCHPCRRKAKGRGPTERAPSPRKWTPLEVICPTCLEPFTQRTYHHTYCSAECRPYSPSRVGKASATARGYGPAHAKTRRWYKLNVVDKGNGYCWRCGAWLDPAEPWDLGHDDHDRSIYRGPECRPCNRGTAATRGNRMRGVRAAQKTQPQ